MLETQAQQLEHRYCKLAGHCGAGTQARSQAERAPTLKLSSLSNQSNPSQKPPPYEAGQYENPLKKYFSISWGQMMAAAEQQWSFYLTSLIHPSKKRETILESVLSHPECLHQDS